MELGAVRRMRQSAQAAPAAQGKQAPKVAASRPGTDRVTLSRQAAALLLAQQQERAQRKAEQREKNWWQLDLIQKEEDGSPADGLKRDMKRQQTCQKIAARIMAGDKVPPEDLKYLMEHDMQGYQLAMASRQIKEHPKEWKSALEKEEQDSESSGSAGGAVEAPAAEGGGAAEASGGSEA